MRLSLDSNRKTTLNTAKGINTAKIKDLVEAFVVLAIGLYVAFKLWEVQ